MFVFYVDIRFFEFDFHITFTPNLLVNYSFTRVVFNHFGSVSFFGFVSPVCLFFEVKSMKFSIGELIIYGETGVCRVEGIEERPFLGEITSCYKLQPLYQSCVIYTPADNSNVYMRPIVTVDEAEALINSFSTVEPKTLPQGAPRVVSEIYDKIIKTHDCDELVSLIVSIYHKRKGLIESKKKLSAIDERFMKKSEDLLFGELAAALEISKSNVSERVIEKMGC
ncbi:MAG: hypothetical protein E7586_02080 [Ruminococcaceae bacterium]|nr:hypothetical protein [Oscillospiraceae bacterium]